MFDEKRRWHKAAKRSKEKWGVPIHVTMAFIHQESKFKSKIKPPRSKILWIFPGPRPSSAFGYAQALKGTWKQYQQEAGGRFADRDNFSDAVDFIGWYNNKSYKVNGIERGDAYHLYLAYHEGHGGFNRRSFKNKQWLKDVAKKVSRKAQLYKRQYKACD